MKHRLLYIPIAFLFLLSFADCAKKGFPTGGDKDSIAPVIVRTSPENYTTNFDKDEIRIYFDEYIKLKELNKNLIISPPSEIPPTITPLSTSKILKIKILDTLKESTTYSFNFGNSIVDNNEENAFEFYKYVFSTGSYIDSLKLSGKVKDAQLLSPEIPATVLLYEVNDAFKDSLIYSRKPTYITSTTDSIGSFELTNLKEGRYLLLALKDKGNDYIFQPRSDKIAFEKEIVSLPSDTTYTLSLFQETLDYKLARSKHESKNHIIFGFEGEADSLQLELLSEVPPEYEVKSFRAFKKDTLHYWFKPALENDSLVFVAKNRSKIDTLTVRLRDLFIDTLKVKNISPGSMIPRDTLKIEANTPIVSFDPEKISVIDRDTLLVETSISINEKYNHLGIFFAKKESQDYSIELLPGAITDFYGKTNDSLSYRIRTQTLSDYGTLSITIANSKEIPLIVQLVDNKFKVVMEKNVSEANMVDFDYIKPATYYLRIIYDENSNGIWDTGNFLKRTAPEKIVYYPSSLEVRSNWSLKETFTLD